MKNAELSKPSLIVQDSLFAPESLMIYRVNSEMDAGLYGLPKTVMNLAKDVKVLCRRTDPQTSKNAAEKTKAFKSRHIAKIWGSLKDYGPMTYKEIAEKTGLEPVAVARRRKEMEENKLIVVMDETRNGCSVWSAK